MRRLPATSFAIDDAVEAALVRVRRWRRRGEARRVWVELRRLCCEHDRDARLWALFGAVSLEQGKRDDALHAFKQSAWFRERAGDERRAQVAVELYDRLDARRRAA